MSAGLTGDYLKVLFARLGITEAVKASTRMGAVLYSSAPGEARSVPPR
jgi:hypothetical protein